MTEKRNYRYPLKNIDKSDDYLKIEALKYKPPGLNEDLNSFALGSSDDTYRNIGTSDIRGSVILPIPESIADANGVKWGEGQMGPLGVVAAGAALNVIGSQDLSKSIFGTGARVANLASNALKQGTVQKMIQGFFASKIVETITGNEIFNQTLARTTGTVFNENIELLFNGVSLRPEFSFRFDMVPRSKKESTEVKDIIRFFKTEMAAKKGNETGAAAGLFLAAPSVFRLQYMSGGQPHPFLNTFKICALRSASVEYTGSGTYATYSDATPVHMVLNLTFQELTPIYREDYFDNDDNFKLKGTGY